MKVIPTEIKDVFIIEPTVYGDERGFFLKALTMRVLKKVLVREFNLCKITTLAQ